MADARLYGFWNLLTEGLQTGRQQNEAKGSDDFFDALYADPDRLAGFMHAMTGLSMGAAQAIAAKFPWQRYSSFAVIDDDRRENVFGLLMSLDMLIETPAGSDYTGADCRRWMEDVGFRETHVEHLAGPDSMVVGFE